MRLFITRCLTLLCFLSSPVLLSAQQKADYTIDLYSGKFILEQNSKDISKNAAVFAGSGFNDKYYVVIQFTTLPSDNDKKALQDAGIQLLDYVPSNAYLAVLDRNFNENVLRSAKTRAIFQLQGMHKTMPAYFGGTFPAHAVKASGMVDLTITTYEKFAAQDITAALGAAGATIIDATPVFKNFTVRIPQYRFKDLLQLNFISWAEPIDAPNALENLPGRTLHRVNILNDGVRNLKGDGINIGIWDGGQINLNHLDFSPVGRVTTVRAGAVSDHATHVAGTITGRGLVNPVARGMAPNAQLFSWDFNTNIPSEMATEIPGRNLLVSSHSYGSTGSPTCSLTDPLGAYSTTSRNTDININTNKTHLHVHSSGNSGGLCAGGFMTITGSGKSAKNNLVVSNVTTLEAISGSSSRGPVHDGRIKPEISAMGTNVFSTWIPNNSYSTISGTSMATPGVSGAAALLHQRYKQLNGGTAGPAALIKNIICNAAEDIGNAGPDYTFGFGRMNALRAVEILEENRYALASVATGAANDVPITVPAGAVSLKVMLTWNDPAAIANAATALVNDLDLTVVNGAITTLPWIMNKNTPSALATRGVDNYSNIEQVTLDNPPAGNYIFKVTGTAVPQGPQEYTLTWIIDQQYIKVLYPNGGENLTPGTFTGNNIQYITWDNAGITGTQTVEYSLNNGGSWTTIASNVAANIKRLAWNPIPDAFTSTALIRISSGAVTDNSDANFKIMNVPGTLSSAANGCNGGEVNLSWTAVTNATHYDILRMDPATGDFVVAAADVAGTTHTITGLTAGATVYFALVAKNNTTGAVSQRGLATSFVVPASGLGAIGSITGNAVICGAASNVTYTVPAVTGATTYTWTVPAGATIVSGQGSTSISVNYPGTAVTGNITVFASSGACQSSMASLPVTASSASITAPVSGGNQSVTHCTPNPMPSLTATATVPAGYSVRWYDAAANGNIVASPVLNSYGTVTYYAASVDNATNCQSNTRTAVVLSITQAPLPAITANGPVTFCQGSSVVLTATAGNSYNWSNGASSQSVTITTGGTYTVTIDQGNGCISTSNPVTVVVNPVPTVSVTASGPTTFCQGGSVQLTASAATNHLWSNGATTPSINVTNGGSYSVTINNGNGCTNTSAATVVTVNPLPTVSLTATPYTKLYPGLTTTLSANATNAASYAWFKNGSLLPAATGASLQVNIDELGDYSVTVTAVGGCSNNSAVLSISDSAVARLFVYPNPTNGQFQVSYHNAPNSRQVISVFDSKGARVYSKSYDLTNTYQRMAIDMRRNRGGVYTIFLSDRNGKKIATGSVVIQ